MEVYEDIIKISKKDSEFTISLAINDSTIVSKVVTKNELQQLYADLLVLLNDEV